MSLVISDFLKDEKIQMYFLFNTFNCRVTVRVFIKEITHFVLFGFYQYEQKIYPAKLVKLNTAFKCLWKEK